MPAHTLAGVGVQDRRQVAEARGKPDVGDVGDPDLVESVYLEVLGVDRVSAKSMSRICGWHKAELWLTQKRLLSHDPQQDRKSTRLNSSHANISYAVFCL